MKTEARKAYLHALKVCRRKIRRFERAKIANEINDERPAREILCPARYRLFNSHVERGRRNGSALILTAAFREGGFSEEKTREMIFEWNERNGIGLGQYELRNVVRSVYRAPAGYRFRCRSLKEWCPYENWRECGEYRKAMAEQ